MADVSQDPSSEGAATNLSGVTENPREERARDANPGEVPLDAAPDRGTGGEQDALRETAPEAGASEVAPSSWPLLCSAWPSD